MSENEKNEAPEHPLEELLVVVNALAAGGLTWRFRATRSSESGECHVVVSHMEYQAEGKGRTFEQASLEAKAELRMALERWRDELEKSVIRDSTELGSVSAVLDRLRLDRLRSAT